MTKLKCAICGFESSNLTSHIVRKHKISISEYKKTYNIDTVQIWTDIQRKNMSDNAKIYMNSTDVREKLKNNVVSCWKKEYWINKGFSEDESKIKISEYQLKNNRKYINNASKQILSENSIYSVKYYIKRNICTYDEAIDIIKQLQSINSNKSNKFLGKHHTEFSKKNISKHMSKYINMIGLENWISHFGNLSTSKIEYDLYNYIKINIDFDMENNIEIEGKMPDMINIKSKKIIEFYGDFWHCNPLFFKKHDINKVLKKQASEIWEKDTIRINFLKSKGYDTLIIWENDWINHKNEQIEIINNFLKE